ncbi:hypothetical protein CVFO_0603 [Isorropodon fossajaponicum endosymbiont JTNG4]|uniref:hypothetical protein n=1 Tax=Isorropodon fossajaponicum symbiont TaxID=883811 RepID=UPI001916A150|nr:hypothetical protein [Isorropodon fossajaponicum symbiont]BBB23854.1 hypothetical protein CVFO_0603 [Isorropodon fossajaponicum endosymbiont JTNG4]
MEFDLNLIYPTNLLNTSFLIIIAIMATADLFTYYLHSTHRDFKSTIISIGVLGTFVGVYIGLSKFDVNDITASVSILLEGLKIAFYTSVAGMSFALFITIIQKTFPGNEELDDSSILQSINKKLEALEEIQVNTKHLQTLPNQITSVLFEIRDLVGVNNEKLLTMLTKEMEEIRLSLEKATESLAKGATEEIIKALEVVISDFNNNLTEQFGDNFKQLNESVVNMIQWQENYKETIDDLESKLDKAMTIFENSIEKGHLALNEVFEQFKLNSDTLIESNKNSQKQLQKTIQNSSEALENTSAVISGLKDDFSSISDMSIKLGSIIETNQNQISNLETHLESMTKVGVDAREMTNSIKDFSSEVQESLTSQSKSLSKMTQELDKQLPESLGKLNKSLTSLTNQFAKDYEKFLKLMSNLVNSKE